MNDTHLPPIALGTWSWGTGAAGGDQVFGNHLDSEDLAPVLDAALDAGLTLFDTAQVYGMGSSEKILGSLIASHPDRRILVSTKFTPQIAGDGANPVADMFDVSRANLGVDDVDLYWIHNPADVERWTPLLGEVASRGHIARVGVSNHNLDQIRRAREILAEHGVELAAVQNHYSMLYRSSEQAGILDYCHDNGMTFFAYMVLEQGALSGRYDAEHPMPAGSQRAATYNPILPSLTDLLAGLRRVADAHDATVAQVSVAWAIARGTLPIIGVTKPEQVADAAAAASLRLEDSEVSELSDLAAASGAMTRGSWEAPMA